MQRGRSLPAPLPDSDKHFAIHSRGLVKSLLGAGERNRVPPNYLSGHEAASRTDLQTEFLAQSLALFQPFEEVFQHADHDGIHADSFFFRPLPKQGPRLCSHMQKLRISQRQTRFARLRDFDFLSIDMAKGEQYHP